jgi:uncharacterized protein (TIGR04255 family)
VIPGTARHYDSAPIVEAMVGFEFPSLTVEQLTRFEDLQVQLRGEYPGVTPYTDGTRTAATDEETPDGFTFVNADGTQVVRITSTSFSFSRLTPYDRWEPFITEARRIWTLFSEFVKLNFVERFVVRYLNELELETGVPLREFFTIYPMMPNPDVLFNSIYLFVETNLDELPGTLQTRMFPAKRAGDRVNIVIDNTFTFVASNTDSIWSNIDLIRDVKNKTFESQITDKMRATLK